MAGVAAMATESVACPTAEVRAPQIGPFGGLPRDSGRNLPKHARCDDVPLNVRQSAPIHKVRLTTGEREQAVSASRSRTKLPMNGGSPSQPGGHLMGCI